MNISQKNNNPVNLRYAGQIEATGKDDKGYAVFPTPDAGWRAAHNQIALDKARNLTLKAFITKFAPPNENDTANYLKFICGELRLGPEQFLTEVSKYALAGVLARMEGYYNRKEGI
jgi:hypothetical protein